jgi:hypothetical protein
MHRELRLRRRITSDPQSSEISEWGRRRVRPRSPSLEERWGELYSLRLSIHLAYSHLECEVNKRGLNTQMQALREMNISPVFKHNASLCIMKIR